MTKDSAGSETFVVRAGFWRIVLLGPLMLFAALLFFFLALVMLFISVGNVLGKLAMVAIALALALLAAYFLLILSTLAMRVEVGPSEVRFRVPNWRGGVVAWLPWVRAALPYSEIASVETRDEVYSSFGMTSVQTAYCVVSKEGRRIVFAYTSPLANWNYQFADAAKLIADRASIPLNDRGAVRAGGIIRAVIRGTPSWDTPSMSPEERVEAGNKAARAMQLAFVVVVIALSIRACTQH
jgi:hypothetical protein